MNRTSQLVLDEADENERELRPADLRRVGAAALILAVLAASAAPLLRTSATMSSSLPLVRLATQACIPPGVAIKNGAMTLARSGHTATLLRSGQVLVAGGWISASAPNVTSAAELYDPTTGAWTSTGSMNVARSFHSAVLLPTGMVLVMGGWKSSDGFGPLASAELYDPQAGTWTATGSMHDGRDSFPAVVLRSGKVFVVGGGLSGGRGAEQYDPASGTWAVTGRETYALLATATVLLSGKILVAGGPLSTQLFDPATSASGPAGSLADWRSWHTATLLRSGKVLVAGGHSSSRQSRTSSAELYDPATNSWTPTSSMTSAHAGAQAILLASGRVLILGGGTVFERTGGDASVDLYDPVSAAWISLGPLTTPRTLFTATLLPRGSVLIAGGEGNSPGPYASTEIYDLTCPPPN